MYWLPGLNDSWEEPILLVAIIGFCDAWLSLTWLTLMVSMLVREWMLLGAAEDWLIKSSVASGGSVCCLRLITELWSEAED